MIREDLHQFSAAGGTHTITYSLSLVPIEERKKSVFDIAEEMRADLSKMS